MPEYPKTDAEMHKNAEKKDEDTRDHDATGDPSQDERSGTKYEDKLASGRSTSILEKLIQNSKVSGQCDQ